MVSTRRGVPVQLLGSPLVMLRQSLEAAGRHVEPRGQRVGCLPLGQGQAADCQQIRRRSEPEIEIDAVFQARHRRAVEGPRSGDRPRDSELDALRPEPTVDLPLLRAPREIASTW